MKNKWIDITLPLTNGMLHWPGDPPFIRTFIKKIGRSSSCNLSKIDMGVHSGTHIDAPLHFIQKGPSIEKVPIEHCIGPARVIAIRDKKKISLKELISKKLRKGERILFKTCNSLFWYKKNEFDKGFVYLSIDAAKYLQDKQIKFVGIDYLSIGGTTPESKGRGVHKILLSSGSVIAEGLDLSGVTEGRYDLICLPLKIVGSEGSPARVLLKKR